MTYNWIKEEPFFILTFNPFMLRETVESIVRMIKYL